MIRRLLLIATVVILSFAPATVRAVPGSGMASPVAKKQTSRMTKLRADLHRNLDGKGDGFIVSWTFTSSRFTLVVNSRLYEKNKLLAATMAARAIFDSDGVSLPKTLIIRDVNGSELGRGPFRNVPPLIE